MNKLIVIFFFCIVTLAARAEVHVQVDPSQVRVDESFRLILTQDTMQDGGIPDLTPLQKDFNILGTERRMNYSVINGQSQSFSEWTITLKPQREGRLIIPPLKIGKELTTATLINVAAGTSTTIETNASTTDQQRSIFLTTEVNNKSPYVNQQIIYKVTLYNSKQLLDADYKGPQVENALLIPLGQEKRYQTQKNNVPYLVEEQNYAVFPQKSGPLKIKSPVFTALIYDFNPERVKAEDKSISLNVQPIPKEYSGKVWLPAKDVRLTEAYEHSDQTITQGNTLIRTVTLEGVGVPAQLLPTLHFAETDGFNVYPEKGKEKNQLHQQELFGRTEIKVTYLFNKAGRVTIPELKLPWFNTETGKEEIASLPEKTIEVSASSADSANTGQGAPATEQKPAPKAKDEIKTAAPTQSNWAWFVAALFAFAWILTLVLWGWQKTRKHSGRGQNKASLKALHKACIEGNPRNTRDALLKWAHFNWPDAPILNLTDLSRLTQDASFKKQVQILSEVLYKNQGKSMWRGDELWRSIQALKNSNNQTQKKTSALPPINPF